MRGSGQSQLLKGALDVAVIAAIGSDESYGYEILQRLEHAGLEGVGDASVYGALKRLEALDYLRSQLTPSTSGPARRYYRVTAKGARWFNGSVTEWRQFTAAIERLLASEGGRG